MKKFVSFLLAGSILILGFSNASAQNSPNTIPNLGQEEFMVITPASNVVSSSELVEQEEFTTITPLFDDTLDIIPDSELVEQGEFMTITPVINSE